MITVSLCMIVKNEQDTIARCLESVKDIVDEIIIVDTGSTDKTKDIANAFTSKIYDFEWIDDFSAARNYSFSKAEMDYIMWLDADDVILEEDRIKFIKMKEILPQDVDIVVMQYNTGFDHMGNVIMSFYRERIFKRIRNFKWNDCIHEYICLTGNITCVNICITHKKIHSEAGRNLRIFEKLISQGSELSVRNLFYYARELLYNGKTDDAIVYFNKFLDTEQGWVENKINACDDLAKCYLMKNDRKNALKAMLRSFGYGIPRAEICCQLGYYYMHDNDYKTASFWFELATRLEKPEYSLGFVLHDFWGYIPNIELCVCHFKLGNIKESLKYNNKAAEYKPDDPSVLYNKSFFKSISCNEL
ncbi:tetratricopeptide repeat protein [Anaerobacterium chartisolvens]|uniref:Tetratricopeptide repeat protein n=1 Tax=Anaerobacterium chartisolvens TaxID=1297424 RepID=A0A369B5V9_9FIRM|nr:glycosyltransferase family 2 protein [Anaerobacterium chartisolvens]RCX16902.1 tetratricopeptide repeat protein [Anaerobacterium chartisolvens]